VPPQAGIQGPRQYLPQIALIVWQSLLRLVRAPDHSCRQQARRAMARRWLWLTAVIAIAVGTLMFAFDVSAIKLMPARGTDSLWSVRIFTDFAKSTYVLTALGLLLAAVLVMLPWVSRASRPVLSALGVRIQYLFFSVLVAVLAGEILKLLIGRGRPFVGGDANAFNFSPFARTEAFASFPSGHAVAAFALAFAVSSVWPRLNVAMWIFAVLICLSRVVLLAHHPSDVVAGALIGIVGAMSVRYWFAARRLGFKITNDGMIVPLQGPSGNTLKRVAREAFAT
jgi:membrane-associated phospholipid phosphatase